MAIANNLPDLTPASVPGNSLMMTGLAVLRGVASHIECGLGIRISSSSHAARHEITEDDLCREA